MPWNNCIACRNSNKYEVQLYVKFNYINNFDIKHTYTPFKRLNLMELGIL